MRVLVSGANGLVGAALMRHLAREEDVQPVAEGRVAGYAADFVSAEIANAAVFAPCDIDGAVAALGRLSLEQMPRPEFVERYARSRIMSAMAKDVLELIEEAN